MTFASGMKLLMYFLRRPDEAVIVARAGWRLRRREWWRKAPFLPVPDPTYWSFRMTTAFGGNAAAALVPGEIVAAARWSLRQRTEK